MRRARRSDDLPGRGRSADESGRRPGRSGDRPVHAPSSRWRSWSGAHASSSRRSPRAGRWSWSSTTSMGGADVPRAPRPPARDRPRCADPPAVIGPARAAERAPEWAEGHAASIVLEPLSADEAGEIVDELLGGPDAAVRDRVATAAEGNPLFVEQIVSMLVETGAFGAEGDRWVATDLVERARRSRRRSRPSSPRASTRSAPRSGGGRARLGDRPCLPGGRARRARPRRPSARSRRSSTP